MDYLDDTYLSYKRPNFHRAVVAENLNLVRKLLKQPKCKVLLDHEDSHQDTALFLAIYANNCPIVQELFKAGANINHVNKSKETPLFHCVRHKDNCLTEYFLAINKNINVNALTIHNETPLFNAVYNNNINGVMSLLNAGASKSINIKTKRIAIPVLGKCELFLDSTSPYDLAKKQGYADILDIFSKYNK